DLGRRHGLEKELRHRGVHAVRAHALTLRPAFGLIRLITGVGRGAFFACGIVLDAHFAATAATEDHPLEQSGAFAGWPAPVRAVPIGMQDVLMLDKLLPGDLGWEGSLEADGPRRPRPELGFRFARRNRAYKGVVGILAVDVDPRIRWIVQ